MFRPLFHEEPNGLTATIYQMYRTNASESHITFHFSSHYLFSLAEKGLSKETEILEINPLTSVNNTELKATKHVKQLLLKTV